MTTQYEYLISYLNSRLKTTNGCHLGVILIMPGVPSNYASEEFQFRQSCAQRDQRDANSDLDQINNDLTDAQNQANIANTDAAEGNVAGARAAEEQAQKDYDDAKNLINALPALVTDALDQAQTNDASASPCNDPSTTDQAYNNVKADENTALAG